VTRSQPAKYWTDEELLALPSNGHRYELVDGQLHDMSPGDGRHGIVITRLSTLLNDYVAKHQLGITISGDTGYRLDADNCLAPDIAFVRADRVRELLPDPDKFLRGAPDLAIEVLSPGDSWGYAERKVQLCFRYGTQLAWVIDPKKKIARIYHGPQKFETTESELSGEDVVPGFLVSLELVFRDYSRADWQV